MKEKTGQKEWPYGCSSWIEWKKRERLREREEKAFALFSLVFATGARRRNAAMLMPKISRTMADWQRLQAEIKATSCARVCVYCCWKHTQQHTAALCCSCILFAIAFLLEKLLLFGWATHRTLGVVRKECRDDGDSIWTQCFGTKNVWVIGSSPLESVRLGQFS